MGACSPRRSRVGFLESSAPENPSEFKGKLWVVKKEDVKSKSKKKLGKAASLKTALWRQKKEMEKRRVIRLGKKDNQGGEV